MHILLVGCGHLGQIMLRRWLAQNTAQHFTIIKLTPLPAEFQDARVQHYEALPANLAVPDIILYAVRPQQLASVLPAYQAIASKSINISVAAGWGLAKLAASVGNVPLLRAMPNVPAEIGQAITPLIANELVTPAQSALAAPLFTAIGEVVWLAHEDQMNAATALSGSGPAYVFLLAAAMQEAGVKLGLSAAMAAALTRATMRGAGNYLANPDYDLTTLHHKVASKGGTTEAAMTKLLAEDGLMTLLYEAMQRAADRAKAMGEE